MRSKKAPRAKTAKLLIRGKRIGLTSAIGPKATTAVVIVVLAGGIWVGSHQRLSAKMNTPTTAAETQAEIGDPSSPNKAAVARAHDAGNLPGATETAAAAKSPKVPVTTL